MVLAGCLFAQSADDLSRYCPMISAIYNGDCSPELVANFLAHQNDVYVRPMPHIHSVEAVKPVLVTPEKTLIASNSSGFSSATQDQAQMSRQEQKSKEAALAEKIFVAPFYAAKPAAKAAPMIWYQNMTWMVD